MKVFLHTRDPKESECVNQFLEFARIPVIGEHVAISSDSPWFKVVVVVHTPFPCDCEAEVYAVKVEHLEVIKASGFKGVG